MWNFAEPSLISHTLTQTHESDAAIFQLQQKTIRKKKVSEMEKKRIINEKMIESHSGYTINSNTRIRKTIRLIYYYHYYYTIVLSVICILSILHGGIVTMLAKSKPFSLNRYRMVR